MSAMERPSIINGIGFRLILTVVALCLLIGGMGGYSVWRFGDVITPLSGDLPAVLEELDRVDRLHEQASNIRYYDELLSHSVHNYAHSGELFWKQRYFAYKPELDLSVQQALALSMGAKRVVIDTIAADLEKFSRLQTRAIGLTDSATASDAMALLRSPEYRSVTFQLRKDIAKFFLTFTKEHRSSLVAVKIASSDADRGLREISAVGASDDSNGC